MIRNLAVSLFVVWHLTVLLFRNPVDIWSEDIKAWFAATDREEARAGLKKKYDRIDNATLPYARFCGTEQGWTMFGSPLARTGPWPALVVVFDDESGALVRSENEIDPAHFWRTGMARQRKLEDHLASSQAGKNVGGEETALWENWVREAFGRWRRDNPDDPRTVAELRFVTRRQTYLVPGQPRSYDEMVQTEIASYTPDAKLIRE